MRRKIQGPCPYQPRLIKSVNAILDRAINFQGDIRALARVLYLCHTVQALKDYKDLSLSDGFLKDKLKPILLDAYRTYKPSDVRGAFFEEIVYRKFRHIHSGGFELGRWALYKDISPVCPVCQPMSADVFESGDSFEVVVECKVSLLSWLRGSKSSVHLSCLELMRKNHEEHSLKVVFTTLDPSGKRPRVEAMFSNASFTPTSILFDRDSPTW